MVARSLSLMRSQNRPPPSSPLSFTADKKIFAIRSIIGYPLALITANQQQRPRQVTERRQWPALFGARNCGFSSHPEEGMYGCIGKIGGGGGIRTHGGLRLDGFQDRCLRPLSHPSEPGHLTGLCRKRSIWRQRPKNQLISGGSVMTAVA